MKGNGKGDVRTLANTRGSGNGSNQRLGNSDSRAPAAAPGKANEAFREVLIGLMLRDDGYLRAIPSGDGEKVFLKWKFTGGPFTGQYVMAVVLPYEVEHGYVLLMTKIVGSYAGMYTPSVDRRYTDE